MSFTLPLAKAAKTLSQTSPTSSLLGFHTFSSAFGLLLFNTLYTVLGIVILYQQDWFQCRKWSPSSVSNLLLIGDNYESEVLFLISGYQFISTAIALAFGYEWRQSMFRNLWFVVLAMIFTFLQFWVTLVPGRMSCFWRVNCDNDNTVFSVSLQEVIPIQNPYATTVMPESFRWTLLVIMILNTLTNMVWEFFVVNGFRRCVAARKRIRRGVTLIPAKSADSGEVAETV